MQSAIPQIELYNSYWENTNIDLEPNYSKSIFFNKKVYLTNVFFKYKYFKMIFIQSHMITIKCISIFIRNVYMF